MYKKILGMVVLALSLNAVVLADDIGGSEYTAGTEPTVGAGIYLGGQLGFTDLHYSGSSYISATTSYTNDYKFAGRAYLGYAFNPFISTELGYDYYGRPKFKHTTGNAQDILQQGMDLVVKATLPLDYGFGVYLKGGLAWIYRSVLHANDGTFVEKGANNKFAPVGAMGINYWFAPHIALDLSWTKTMSVGDLPTIDLFTAGIIYKINI